MAKLFVLIGLPGAGKSTFAQVVRERNKKIEYVSSDELRKEFSEFKDNHSKIFDIMNKRTIDMLRKNNSVIYDSTNLERKYRIDLFNKIRTLSLENLKVEAVFIHNGLNKAIEQSKNRKNRNDVNEKLIRDMYETMELPSVNKDCDEIIIPYIFNINNEFDLKYCKIYKNDEDFYKYVKEVDVLLYEKDLDEGREYD